VIVAIIIQNQGETCDVIEMVYRSYFLLDGVQHYYATLECRLKRICILEIYTSDTSIFV
jgi:hypothetical protein